MTRSTSPASKALRALGLLLVLIAALSPSTSHGLTTLSFAPLRSQLTNEIGALESLPDPSSSERARLRTLQRGSEVLDKSSLKDGKALRMVKNILGRFPDYSVPLDTVASNLVAVYNNQYTFVGMLIPELPPSPEATAVAAQYNGLANAAAKLNAQINAAKTSARYDAAKRKLDNVFFRANSALLVPFPTDLVPNQVFARIDNGSGPRSFTASATSSDLNVFEATQTGDRISITLSAVDSSRGILFTIPDVQLGTFRYELPTEGSFTNRTDLNFFTTPPTSTDVGATNGSFFVSTTATEVYGIFECSGPGFGIINGRFRIHITTP